MPYPTRSQRRDFEHRINRIFFRKAIQDLHRIYLRNNSRRSSIMMTRFILNPYDQELDLTRKDHLRLYIDGCAGLKEEVKFDGRIENYPSFVKLIGKRMEEIRVKECLRIATEWETTGTNPEFPVKDKILDLFDTNGATKAQIDHHVGLIWAETDKDHTNELPIRVNTKPGDNAALSKVRNFLRLKHVMFGSLLWNSLTSSFQLEIVGQDEENFRQGNEYDGVKLWHFIRAHVNPSTTTGASGFKDEIESATMSSFKDDIKAFNTWFDDKRKAIIKEEGEGKYNEYTRSIFKTYLTSKNTEFVDTIKAEKREWSNGRKPDTYSYRDVMKLARTTFNNLNAEKNWNNYQDNEKLKESKIDDDPKYLALTAQIERLEKTINTNNNTKKGNNPNNNNGNGNNRPGWRYQNPDNKTELVRNNKTYKWCDKDCHPQPMWCPRTNCMNRADYKKAMDNKRKVDDGQSSKYPNDFKVALSAIVSDEDYKALEAQFFDKAGK